MNDPINEKKIFQRQKGLQKTPSVCIYKKLFSFGKRCEFQIDWSFYSRIHYSIIYSKDNQEELDLLYVNPEDIEPDILDEKVHFNQSPPSFFILMMNSNKEINI